MSPTLDIRAQQVSTCFTSETCRHNRLLKHPSKVSGSIRNCHPETTENTSHPIFSTLPGALGYPMPWQSLQWPGFTHVLTQLSALPWEDWITGSHFGFRLGGMKHKNRVSIGGHEEDHDKGLTIRSHPRV